MNSVPKEMSPKEKLKAKIEFSQLNRMSKGHKEHKIEEIKERVGELMSNAQNLLQKKSGK